MCHQHICWEHIGIALFSGIRVEVKLNFWRVSQNWLDELNSIWQVGVTGPQGVSQCEVTLRSRSNNYIEFKHFLFQDSISKMPWEIQFQFGMLL